MWYEESICPLRVNHNAKYHLYREGVLVSHRTMDGMQTVNPRSVVVVSEAICKLLQHKCTRTQPLKNCPPPNLAMRLRKVGLLFLEVMEKELRPVAVAGTRTDIDVDDTNNYNFMHHQTLLPPNNDFVDNDAAWWWKRVLANSIHCKQYIFVSLLFRMYPSSILGSCKKVVHGLLVNRFSTCGNWGSIYRLIYVYWTCRQIVCASISSGELQCNATWQWERARCWSHWLQFQDKDHR